MVNNSSEPVNIIRGIAKAEYKYLVIILGKFFLSIKKHMLWVLIRSTSPIPMIMFVIHQN